MQTLKRGSNYLGSFLLGILAVILLGAAPLHAEGSKVINQTSGEVFTNLQVAIDAASAGDTLKVIGTFHGSFIISQDLILQGRNNATLDGDNAGRVLTVFPLTSSVTVTLVDITIQNGLGIGSSFIGGGGILNINSNVVLKSCSVINNISPEFGGGILMATLVGVEDSYSVSLTLEDTLVSNNQAAASGGGIANTGGLVDCVDSVISSNQAALAGGGIFSAGGTNTITGSKIKDNQAGQGGGLENVDDSLSIITDTHFKNNAALLGGGIFNGSGGFIGSNLILVDSKLHRNKALAEGGGLFNDSESTATIEHTKIKYNEAILVGGGILNNVGGILLINFNDSEIESNSPDNIFEL